MIKAIPTSLLLDSVSFSLIDEIKRYLGTNSCFVLGFYLFIIFLSRKNADTSCNFTLFEISDVKEAKEKCIRCVSSTI